MAVDDGTVKSTNFRMKMNSTMVSPCASTFLLTIVIVSRGCTHDWHRSDDNTGNCAIVGESLPHVLRVGNLRRKATVVLDADPVPTMKEMVPCAHRLPPNIHQGLSRMRASTGVPFHVFHGDSTMPMAMRRKAK